MESFGNFVCNISDRIYFILPESPYTLGDLADQLGENVPFIGSYLIYKATSNIASVLILVAGYKLIKILPGKF
jgi:hypothetical protein